MSSAWGSLSDYLMSKGIISFPPSRPFSGHHADFGGAAAHLSTPLVTSLNVSVVDILCRYVC